jgi:flagella basal body P-ring formation protein FlgA
MIRNLAFAAITVAALTSVAAADEARPRLKAQATVTGGIVRVGDLVENAGIIAKVPIFRAPDLGATGTVPAEAVVEAVRQYQLIGLDTGDVSEVVVTRASRTIPARDIEDRVAQALAAQYALGPVKDIVVHFDRELRAIQVEPSAKGDPRVAYLNFDARSGRFDVTLDMPTGATTRGLLRLSGQAAATAEVVTLARPLDRGEVLKNADLVVERRPRAEIGRDVATHIEQALGQAARVQLRAGQPLRLTDLMKPEVVQHNDTVTLIYQMPGIRLTVRGKATEGGAEGDIIGVLNEQSKRTVQGVVVGPGRVLVSTSAPQLAANLPPNP